MSYTTPVRFLPQGSTEEITASGTLLISSGGSIQVASGGIVQIASGGSLVNAGANSLSGVQTIASGGLLNVASGGSINIAAGGSIQSVHGIQATTMTLGGTQGRWSFGTAALTSGVGTVATGLGRVYAASANAILGEAQGAGSAAHVMIDLSLSASGSVIMRLGSVGGGVWAANGTVSYLALGT